MTYSNIRNRPLPFLLGYFSDVMAYRHLCWNLVGSDLRTRFRRSTVGILWAAIQPMAFALMVAAVWGAMFGEVNYWEYALYVFSGIILWEYFSVVVVISQDALINAEGYLKQTRIPFLTFQVRTPLTAMIVMFFGMIGLIALQMMLGRAPLLGLHTLLIPLFFVLFLLFAMPLAIALSVLGTMYRDVKYISQIGVQAMFFLTPVMLQRAILDKPELAPLKYLNPMVPFLDLFRAPVLHGQLWSWHDVAIVGIWIVALWVVALVVSANVGRRLIFAL